MPIDFIFSMTYSIAYVKDDPMETLKVSEARTALYGLIDDVAEAHAPVHIAGKRNSDVQVSLEDWDAI